MANNPKKLADPADEALTAIQQVLSVSDDPIDTPHPAAPVKPAPPRQEPPRRPSHASAPVAETDLFEGAIPSHDDVRPGQYAANDDRQTIGQILRTLEQRPSRGPYVTATLFGLAWAACGVALAFLYLPDLQAVLKQGQAGTPAMIGLAGFVLAPIVFFYLLATMMWRSQEI